MPTHTQPPGNSQPEAQPVLLAAFRASLTSPGTTFAERALSCAGLRPLTADIVVPTPGPALTSAIELGGHHARQRRPTRQRRCGPRALTTGRGRHLATRVLLGTETRSRPR